MKKTLLILSILLLALPLAAGAVQWTKESAEFTFTVGVEKNVQSTTLSPALHCRYDAGKGAAIFRCVVPIEAKKAVFSVYSLSGALISAAEIKAGTSVFEWRASGKKVPAGIYVAVVRYGSADQKLQFSIIN